MHGCADKLMYHASINTLGMRPAIGPASLAVVCCTVTVLQTVCCTSGLIITNGVAQEIARLSRPGIAVTQYAAKQSAASMQCNSQLLCSTQAAAVLGTVPCSDNSGRRLALNCRETALEQYYMAPRKLSAGKYDLVISPACGCA